MPTRTRNMIYPGVGVARLGPSTKEIFIGPEVPDPEFVPMPIKHPNAAGAPSGSAFRDRDGRIRRQAARFRVYRVKQRKVGRAWVPIEAREITADDATLTWTVTVANCKSFTGATPPLDKSARVQNVAPAKTVSGRDQPVQRLEGAVQNLLLAEIFTDAKGRLLVLAGLGECRPTGGAGPPSGLFSANWFDDVCDGSVECTVDGKSAERAWIVTGVPVFAQQIGHLVTLYDVAETIAIATRKLPAPKTVSIVRDIYPMLRTTDLQSWVSESASEHTEEHRSSEAEMKKVSAPAERDLRRFIFTSMRNPNVEFGSRRKSPYLPHWYPSTGGAVVNDFDSAIAAVENDSPPRLMPKQAGLTFTLWQWKRFEQWSKATRPQDLKWDYVDHATSIKRPKKLEDRLGANKLDALDDLNRAHLGSIVGGSTTPGIEVGWPALETKSWGDAFRPRSPGLQPGDLTWTLSVPWPQDYRLCSRQPVQGDSNDWWPAARPVLKAGSPQDWMRSAPTGPDWWKSRGFFKNDGTGKYTETDGP